METSTEEPDVAKDVRLVELNPLDSVERGIDRSLINIPADRSSCRTIVRTDSEESHSARWIDQLKFKIWNTQHGNDASQTDRKVFHRSNKIFTQWRPLGKKSLPRELEGIPCLLTTDSDDVPWPPWINSLIRMKGTREKQQGGFRWLRDASEFPWHRSSTGSIGWTRRIERIDLLVIHRDQWTVEMKEIRHAVNTAALLIVPIL